jgi:hypothetical protein
MYTDNLNAYEPLSHYFILGQASYTRDLLADSKDLNSKCLDLNCQVEILEFIILGGIFS